MNNIDNDSIVSKNNQLYNSATKKYGNGSGAVLWDDQQTQYLRFSELIKNIDLNDENKTLLDVGCGNGEFYKFLNFSGYRGKYIGYDINKILIKQAKDRFGKEYFYVKDILSEKVNHKFNYVLMSGLFNTNVGQSKKWTETFLSKMFFLSKELISFNAISKHVNFKEKCMFYLSPELILEFCITKLSPRVTLSHHNLPYNYTVTVFKNNNWTSLNKIKK